MLARDATEGRDNPRVKASVDDLGESVRLTVEDNGTGIDPNIQHRLFDAFFTTKPEGLGMGLPISKSIIETHHGQLQFDSNGQSGTTFRILLPIKEPAAVIL